MSLSHFQEKAGVVACETEWGCWSQTCDEVNIEVKLSESLRSKDLKIIISSKTLSCSAMNKLIFEGELYSYIHVDESMWSLEDGNLVRILLSKAKGSEVWPSLMANEMFSAPAHLLLEMKKQIDLELFQKQYPGMDFSTAKLQKCYDVLK